MKAITKFLAGGVAIAALAVAAPAAAQFFPGMNYPGYGSPYGNPGYGSPYGNPGYGAYGYNQPGGSRIAVSQCTAAVQQRLGGYGGYGYSYGNGGARVIGINSVEIRNNGGYKVRGTAATGGGYAYGGAPVQFTCNTDGRGFVTGVRVDNGYYGNGYGGNGYGGNGYDGQGYNNPYGVYGYQRY